jgi:outer membrane biosynthesis protein TonB
MAATAQDAVTAQDAETAQDAAPAQDAATGQGATTGEEAVTALHLAAQLEEARERLDGLVRDLRAVEAELEALATERAQHRLLHDACGALDELKKIGGAALFWDDKTAAAASDEHLRRVRERVAVFQGRVDEIEARRHGLLAEIDRQQEHTYLLEDDVFEALEEEERRKHEWIVEREIDAISSREPVPAWTRGVEDDRRFRKSLAIALLASFLIALILPLIDLPLRVLEEPADVPERVVTLMMEELPQPPAPVILPEPKEKLVEQKPVEEPEPQRVVKAEEPEPEPAEAPAPEQGILAFREKLAQIKESPLVALGAQARINNSNGNSASRPERSMLTTNAPGSSGGIRLAALSRDFGSDGGGVRGPMQGAALTQASSSIKAVGPGDRPLSDGPGLARTDEEIQIVFDRYKSALYRLYNRELRRDPTLQGQMILRLTIEPDGSVSFCQLHATDMKAPDLVTQVVDRVRTFDFGAKEVPAITIVYPIDFLPAA